MLKKLIIISIFQLFLTSAFSIPADVEDISNEKYFPKVLETIQKAEKSIYILIYYISYSQDGKVKQLLNALIEKAKSGVDIEVILDSAYEDGKFSDKNLKAYSYLKNNSVKVFYDEIEKLSHAKYLIIDENTVITGSFNWSENSLNFNRESGVLISSPDLVNEYLKLFREIQKGNPDPVKNGMPIPIEFLRNKELASKMISAKRHEILDFYLLVQKKSYEQKTNKIIISIKELEDYMYNGKPPLFNYEKMDTVQYFKACNLRGWIKRFPFIKSYKRDSLTKDLIVDIDKINEAKEDSLYLSELYWTDQWYRRLNAHSKFCLFYILDKTDSGKIGRYFEQCYSDACKEYQVDDKHFSYGLTQLQRFNLIEKDIYYEIGEKNPNGVTLNDFYKYEDFEKELEKIKSNTEQKLFETVITIADLVNEPNDIACIKELISLGNKYGLKVMEDTLKVMKKHDNGVSRFRQFKYIIGVIKKEGEGFWPLGVVEFEESKKKFKMKF